MLRDPSEEPSKIESKETVPVRSPSWIRSAALCITIALFHVSAAANTTHIQRNCHYESATVIPYLNQAFLGCVVLIGLPFTRLPQSKMHLLRVQGPWVLFLAPLSLLCNAAFVAALRFTSVAAAVTLEQLAPLFIAGLSCWILKTKYCLTSIPFLCLAVVGASVATLADQHGSIVGGRNPLVGDALSIAVAFSAGLYMVVFKYAFPVMSPPELMFFIGLRAAVTLAFGWIVILAFDGIGVDTAALPSGDAAPWVFLGAVLAGIFNAFLSWTTVLLSPLSARLALLLAIPCSSALDLFTYGTFSTQRLLGVVLIFLGVLGFECCKNSAAVARHDNASPIQSVEAVDVSFIESSS